MFSPSTHEAYEIAAFIIVAVLVGDPDLYPRNIDSRCDVRQTRSESVIVVVEILGKEEMAVGIVVIGLYGEIGGLHAPWVLTVLDSLFCWLTRPVRVSLPNCSFDFKPKSDVPRE